MSVDNKWITVLNRFKILIFQPILVIMSLYKNTCNTRRNQDDRTFLVVLNFQWTIYKSTRQFGFSFAFDAATIWNALPNDVCTCPSIDSFKRKLNAYFFSIAYPPYLPISICYSVVLTSDFYPWTMIYWSPFLIFAP